MKISKKKYICLACNNITEHETNHEGEIYCQCKKCGNLGLHPQSKLHLFEESEDFAIFHFYRFNIDEEKHKYLELCNFLSSLNYKNFNTLYNFELTNLWQEWDNSKIKILNVNQFEDQYVTNKGRLHQWSEVIFPNRKIKKGYYLDSFQVKS